MGINTYILISVNCNTNEIEIDITKTFLTKIEIDLLATTFWEFSWDVEGSLTATNAKKAHYWIFETTPSNLEYLVFELEEFISKLLPSQSVRINFRD